VALHPESEQRISGNGAASNGRNGRPKNGKFRIPDDVLRETRMAL
jgi:hypothetical protein